MTEPTEAERMYGTTFYTVARIHDVANQLMSQSMMASQVHAESMMAQGYRAEHPGKRTRLHRLKWRVWGQFWEPRERIRTAWAVLRGTHDCGDW